MDAVYVLSRSGCLQEPSDKLSEILSQVLAHPDSQASPCMITLQVDDMDTVDGDRIGMMQLMRGIPAHDQLVRRIRWKMSASFSQGWATSLLKDVDPENDMFPYLTLNSGVWSPPLSERVALAASMALCQWDATYAGTIRFVDSSGAESVFECEPDRTQHPWVHPIPDIILKEREYERVL